MTLAAPIHLNRRRGFRSGTRLQQAGATAPAGTTRPTTATPRQVILMVDFTSPEARSWWAVGVGDTLAEALAFAQDSCPTDTTWQATSWNDLYGD